MSAEARLWEYRRLKYVAQLNQLKLPDTTEPNTALRYVDISTVNKTGEVGAPQELTFDAAPSRARRRARCGDTIISTVRTYLEAIAYVEDDIADCVFSTGFAVVQPSASMHPRFLYYAIRSAPFVSEVARRSVGVSYPAVNASDLADIEVPVPPLAQQREIALRLDQEVARLDELLRCKRQTFELLHERRAGTIDRAFFGFDAQRWPVKWVVRGVQVGIVVQPSQYYKPSGWPLLRGLNVKPGRVVRDDLKFIDDHDNQVQAKSRLRAGDLVVVRTGKAGATAVVPDWADGANCVDLLIVRPSDRLDPRFLEYFLNSGEAQRQVEQHSVGAIQSHFNVEAMKRLLIPVPPLREQRATVDRLDYELQEQDAVRAASGRQLDLLAERRRSLITYAIEEAPREAQVA